MLKHNIQSYIPQSLEMVLIDELVKLSTQSIRTKAHITQDNAFLCLDDKTGKKQFASYNILEIFAQSLALWRSLQEQNLHSNAIPQSPSTPQNLIDTQNKSKLGFLLGARGFEIFAPFVEVGQSIEAILRVNMQDENGLGVYEGEAFVNGKMIAKTSLTALNPNDEFLSQIMQDNN